MLHKLAPRLCVRQVLSSRCKLLFSTIPKRKDAAEKTSFHDEQEKYEIPVSSLSEANEPHSIVTCFPENEGKNVVIRFGDGSIYKFKTAWLRDSHPMNAGEGDYNRKNPSAFYNLNEQAITKANIEGQESNFVKFDFLKSSEDWTSSSSPSSDRFYSKWLYAWAPFVGKNLSSAPGTFSEKLNGTGSLLDSLMPTRVAWEAEGFDVPVFDSSDLRTNEETQLRFFETMIKTGTCMINNIGPPASMERNRVSEPLHDLVYDVVGKMNQHNVRKNACGVISTNVTNAGMDYDLRKPLSMHNDHSPYAGTPGFLQFMYQAEGNVTSRLADGMAIANYMMKNFPEDWELLKTIPMTYAIRNLLYQPGGAKRILDNPDHKSYPFELVHTSPVLRYDEDGNFVQCIQSETKRGNCALPYDIAEKYISARQRWMRLCEEDRFVCYYPWPEHTVLVTNNWRVLHGRAFIAEGMKRTMTFGYTNKNLVDNRYRLLKQNQAERSDPRLGPMELSRLPNQVLSRLIK